MAKYMACGSVFGLLFLGLFAVAALFDGQPYTAHYRMFAIGFGFVVGLVIRRSYARG